MSVLQLRQTSNRPGSEGNPRGEIRYAAQLHASATASLPRRAACGSSGSQLVEFAMALPLLILLVVGVLDMATAFNIKQKLTNAAREGARLAASDNGADLTATSPASVETIRNAVVAYLNNSGVDTSFIGTAMTPAGGLTWTYYSSGTNGLKINRAFAVPAAAGGTIISTQITLTYPYDWTFGFANVASSGTVVITTWSVMPNIP